MAGQQPRRSNLSARLTHSQTKVSVCLTSMKTLTFFCLTSMKMLTFICLSLMKSCHLHVDRRFKALHTQGLQTNFLSALVCHHRLVISLSLHHHHRHLRTKSNTPYNWYRTAFDACARCHYHGTQRHFRSHLPKISHICWPPFTQGIHLAPNPRLQTTRTVSR